MLSSCSWVRDQYELIDFGAGRKLERFGQFVLDRPSPAAEPFVPTASVDWSQADARIDDKGNIELGSNLAKWSVRLESMVFNLKLTPFGHVGLFPEQADNWRWLQDVVVNNSAATAEQPAGNVSTSALTALNLFAYTGGTTLALALAGAKVVHVDASTPAVTWARENAQLSGLQEHPIRWIVEDARKFVARELRRGSRYDAIVMDPPSYGHGPSGKPWIISEHLPELIDNAIALLRQDGNSYLLITAHCDRPSPAEIIDMIRDRCEPKNIADGRLELIDQNFRPLDAGFYIRTQF